MAERAGISYKYIGEIERGQVNLSVEKLLGLAQALHVAPGELIDVEVREAAVLSKAKFILADLPEKELSMALEMLESLKRHSTD